MKVELFKLLSCEARLEIMKMLISNDHVCVCDIEMDLGLSQANASKHMRLFRNLDIVCTKKCGKSVLYKLTDDFKQTNKRLIDYICEEEKYEKNSGVC